MANGTDIYVYTIHTFHKVSSQFNKPWQVSFLCFCLPSFLPCNNNFYASISAMPAPPQLNFKIHELLRRCLWEDINGNGAAITGSCDSWQSKGLGTVLAAMMLSNGWSTYQTLSGWIPRTESIILPLNWGCKSPLNCIHLEEKAAQTPVSDHIMLQDTNILRR